MSSCCSGGFADTTASHDEAHTNAILIDVLSHLDKGGPSGALRTESNSMEMSSRPVLVCMRWNQMNCSIPAETH